ncbi:COX5A-domain-containing protein [Violaceomyces palustris]|uniref:COX5A-domain-containing protein n=1 Tax=Violaceomyces palustris TaxID=1673888 RepID=A0ACD0P6U9_9BASI|nr:COX5A-domain-containing protein [Violaceomyces palustris]
MSFLTGVFKTAAIGASSRAALRSSAPLAAARQVRFYAAHSHEDESFEAFNARYVGFFDAVEDLFELQRGLNNCFAYDLVPSPEVIESALRASRRVNDYSTAVRVFEGIKQKVENEGQYKQYVEALKGVREELGECLLES